MTLWSDDHKAYSADDAKLIDEVLGELYRKGERTRWSDRTDHIYGLGAWIAKNLDRIERFIFACRNLRMALQEEKALTSTLKTQLHVLVGTNKLIDLGGKRDLEFRCRDSFRGFMVPDSQADALVAAINTAIERASRYGFSEGSSVLRRLATGDMSVTDFEKKEAEKG